MRMLRSLGVLVCTGIPNVPFRLPATPFDMIVKGKLINSVLETSLQFIPTELLSRSCWPQHRPDDRRKLRRHSEGDGRIGGDGCSGRRQGAYWSVRLWSNQWCVAATGTVRDWRASCYEDSIDITFPFTVCSSSGEMLHLRQPGNVLTGLHDHSLLRTHDLCMAKPSAAWHLVIVHQPPGRYLGCTQLMWAHRTSHKYEKCDWLIDCTI